MQDMNWPSKQKINDATRPRIFDQIGLDLSETSNSLESIIIIIIIFIIEAISRATVNDSGC